MQIKKKRDVIAQLPTEKVSETGSPHEWLASGIFALLLCLASLYLQWPHIAIFCFGVYLVLRLNKLPPFLEKNGEKIFIVISMLIVIVGIVNRIVMIIEYRSLWHDEAAIAESILARNWAELLVPPLSNGQSAPVLYVIAVKAICLVYGTSENMLRLFSGLSYLGLLVLEWFFLKKVLKVDNIKTGLILALTAVMPCYIFYSNELKPYMSDAFFVVLALLLYAFYTQNKLSLVKLTFCYVLILGFCTPAIFFIGGVLVAEFLTSAFARDKKHAIHVLISGLSIAVIFGLYYYWWMLPALDFMNNYWNKSPDNSNQSLLEVFSITLVISSYFLYKKKKPSLIYLSGFYLLILVFCPPAVFFAGGILVAELFAAAFARDKKELVLISTHILSIAMIFGLYYLIRTQFVSESITNFWNNPQGKTRLIFEIKNIFSIELVRDYDSVLVYAFVPFALLGIYSLIKQRNKIAYSVALSMLFVVLASSIGKWPLNARLWLFLPAVVLLSSSAGFDFISKSNNIIIKRVVFCLFLGITLNWAYDSVISISERRVYLYREEANPLIQYVKDHIKDDEKLYVYSVAVPVVKFKNGYKTNKIGRTTQDNIIYGANRDEWTQNELGPELKSILQYPKVYLLFQHWHGRGINGIDAGLDVLQKYGTVTLVLNNAQTPLFYFKRYDNTDMQDQP